MRAGRHVIEGGLDLAEAEYAIDRRLDFVRGNGGVHRLEHLGRADGDALHIGASEKIKLGLSSVAPPLTLPMMLILPPMRMALNERVSVATPPTSSTWSTPRPPVNSRAALSHSGVVL